MVVILGTRSCIKSTVLPGTKDDDAAGQCRRASGTLGHREKTTGQGVNADPYIFDLLITVSEERAQVLCPPLIVLVQAPMRALSIS